MSVLDVTVVCAWPDQVWRRTLRVEEGSTVGKVLAGLPWSELAGIDTDRVKTGIFGRLVGPDEILRHGDRIELYRPLEIDPKQVRRERAEHAKETAAGRR